MHKKPILGLIPPLRLSARTYFSLQTVHYNNAVRVKHVLGRLIPQFY